MGAVGYGRNGEKYQYTTLASHILEYLALPKEKRPSRAVFEEEIFPSDGEMPPRDFDKDDTFSRRLVTSQFENLYTHRTLWNGIDIVGWRPSPQWTPEHERYLFYAIEVKGRTRRGWKISMSGESSHIKVKEKQPGNMLREIAALQDRMHGSQMTTYRGKTPITLTQAKGYFGIAYLLETEKRALGVPPRQTPQILFLMRPEQIMQDEKRQSRFISPSAHTKNPYRNYRHYRILLNNGRSLVQNGILTPRELPHHTQQVWPNFEVFAPRGAIMPTFATQFQEPIEQEYEGIEDLEQRIEQGETGHQEEDSSIEYQPTEVEPGIYF